VITVDLHEFDAWEVSLRVNCPNIEEVIMEKNKEPWHELIFVCPYCRKEFRPETVGLHVRLCPDCEVKKEEHASVMKQVAKNARSSRASTSGLLEGIVGNR
jgi:hypothetical protein